MAVFKDVEFVGDVKISVIATAIRDGFTDLRAGLQANNEAYTWLCNENKKLLASLKKQQTTNKKLSALKYEQESVIDKLEAELLACKDENKKLLKPFKEQEEAIKQLTSELQTNKDSNLRMNERIETLRATLKEKETVIEQLTSELEHQKKLYNDLYSLLPERPKIKKS